MKLTLRTSDPLQIKTACLVVGVFADRWNEPLLLALDRQLDGRLKAVPGARFTLGAGGTGEKIQLALAGDDPVLLQEAARAVEQDLRAMPGLGNVTSTASLLRPEIMIRPDYARAAELGVTASAIGETVQVATAGDYDAALPKLNLPERQVDIRVQLPVEMRRDLEALKELRVPGNHGLVPLSSVADVSVGSGPAQVATDAYREGWGRLFARSRAKAKAN